MSKARKSFPLRLAPDLYDAVKGWAEQEMRSVNAQIEFILKQAVVARGKLKQDAPSDDANESDSEAENAE